MTIAVFSNTIDGRIYLDKAYDLFSSSDTSDADVTIDVYYGDLPDLELQAKNKLFESEGLWSLYSVGGKYVFVLRTPGAGETPYRVAIFDEDFRSGQVFSRKLDNPWWPNGYAPDPLEFPLSEALTICLLAQGRGLMVHACGVADADSGYLFAGNSTHGKSTLAKIWMDKTQAAILNDDRVIIRERNGQLWMYGTPWHGEQQRVSSKAVPLKKIFFLSQSDQTHCIDVQGVTAVSMLLARSFPPLWDKAGMAFTLDLCSKITESTSRYKLSFALNKKVVDIVRGAP